MKEIQLSWRWTLELKSPLFQKIHTCKTMFLELQPTKSNVLLKIYTNEVIKVVDALASSQNPV